MVASAGKHSSRAGIFLTGATGFLGPYLLKDLLLAGHSVTVLVRDAPGQSAGDRIAAILSRWSEQLQRPLPQPTILVGDLTQPDAGMTAADRRWLGEHCGATLHAAASLSFLPVAGGEPRRTNVEGTAAILHLCQDAGISRFHHVSTAFVCGRRQGTIREDEREHDHGFYNLYEESKYEAEALVQSAAGMQVTIYRPAVIVGESETGYTSSYTGFYRVLEMAVRLAGTPDPSGVRFLPLRLPLRGDEPCNLVCVDWVSRAIVELLHDPCGAGRTFHLTSDSPATAALIKQTAATILRVEGVEFAGPGLLTAPTSAEEAFWDGVQRYWPYLGGTPAFDNRNTRSLLPHLPAPVIDTDRMARLVRFATADRWGRYLRPATSPAFDCASYIESVFPEQARSTNLARELDLDVVVAVDIRGPGGGQWSCAWRGGELQPPWRGLSEKATAIYVLDSATFAAIVERRLSPQQAFLDRGIEIKGDLESGLKLALLFGHFLEIVARGPRPSTEAIDVPGCNRGPVRR
jgi:thioester reductase-like protein